MGRAACWGCACGGGGRRGERGERGERGDVRGGFVVRVRGSVVIGSSRG